VASSVYETFVSGWEQCRVAFKLDLAECSGCSCDTPFTQRTANLAATATAQTYPLPILPLSQAALKVRKGDFDHIVDDVSDGEGDEAAGAAARAEMELQEDRARDRAIITAVTEGHDAMRKMQKKGKYTFEKLVGGGETRREAAGEATTVVSTM
jgi:hypothetical protein